MYTRIAVPLDTSKRAEKILPHVQSLCGIKMGKVILVHVIEPTVFPLSRIVPSSGSPQVTPQAYVERREELCTAGEEYLSRSQTILRTKHIDAEVVIETGQTAERIVCAAEKSDTDLIAIASHGRTGLPRVLFGSDAAAVLHRSEIPLLPVRSIDDA